ncbi:MAG: hypothetical protein IPP71_17400 [Bacteroidetes bacterium]|nr:hypothetical protein [Bacteroidota bacterium]
MNALKISGLFCVYLSMNYFVVREGNILLNETTLSYPTSAEYKAIQLKIDKNQEVINNSYSDSTATLPETEISRLSDENSKLYEQLYVIEKAELNSIRTQSIPIAWIFILLTILFPVLYIYYGLSKKDRIVLFTGLAILVFTVFTYKYYNQLYPLEYTITFAGIVMLIFSWWAIRYLKSNPAKFTYEADKDSENQDLLNAEALLVSQTVNQSGNVPEQGTHFGGGSFGGGGAGGNL